MSTVLPWWEFVLCPDLPGMLFQMARAKSVGDLWGQIDTVSFDGRELVVTLAWTTTRDPRTERAGRTNKVRTIRILPQMERPYYTVCVALAVRDMNTGYECFIRYPNIMRCSRGRITSSQIVAF